MQLDENLNRFNLFLVFKHLFLNYIPQDNQIHYSNAHPHGYFEKSLSWEGEENKNQTIKK